MIILRHDSGLHELLNYAPGSKETTIERKRYRRPEIDLVDVTRLTAKELRSITETSKFRRQGVFGRQKTVVYVQVS